jgi:cell division protein FtsZ
MNTYKYKKKLFVGIEGLDLDFANFASTAKVCVVGVGTGGINAINYMSAAGLQGVFFIAADTDTTALAEAQAEHTIQLGPSCCKGLGTNGDPNVTLP